MATLLEKISGIRTTDQKTDIEARDLGCDILGDHIGACARATHYKKIGADITNPPADRLIVARQIGTLIKDLYIERIKRAVDIAEAPYEWTWDSSIGPVKLKLDAVYKEDNPGIHGTFLIGVMIFTGSGYGFRSEVFGSTHKQGGVKDGHMVQCWATMLTSPLPLKRIDVIYVDRDRLDEAMYMVGRPDFDITEFETFTQKAVSLPPCDYEKQWTSREHVAKLYAEKKISKKKYEAWMDTSIGGDWICDYCPYLQLCEQQAE